MWRLAEKQSYTHVLGAKIVGWGGCWKSSFKQWLSSAVFKDFSYMMLRVWL